MTFSELNDTFKLGQSTFHTLAELVDADLAEWQDELSQPYHHHWDYKVPAFLITLFAVLAAILPQLM